MNFRVRCAFDAMIAPVRARQAVERLGDLSVTGCVARETPLKRRWRAGRGRAQLG